MVAITTVRLERDADVSRARRTARTAVAAIGHDLHDQTRFATAVSEIARNALQYAGGGRVEFAIERVEGRPQLTATVTDAGSGIAEIDSVLGGSYRSEQGLGLGIRGVRRITDHFGMNTGPGGTTVTLGIELRTADEPAVLSRRVADALAEAARRNPVDELTEQNRALRDAYARQAFLQRELHHRTKNNLAIIHSYAAMQARRVKSDEARSALAALAGRVQALGLVHSFLHRAEGAGQIDLREYLGELARSLGSAFAEGDGEIVCEIEPVPLEPDQAVEVGILVNELVTNAMKHAAANGEQLTVRVAAGRSGGSLVVSVSDNGIGLEDPEGVMRNSPSLGWRVVKASAQKLRGKIEVDGSKGLTVRITMPL